MEIVEDVEQDDFCDNYKFYDQVKILLKQTLYSLEVLQNIIISYLQNIIYLNSNDNKQLACYIPYLEKHSEVIAAKINVSNSILEMPFSYQVLQMIVDYVNSHKLSFGSLPTKPLISNNMIDNTVCKWDAWFADRFDLFPNSLLYDIMLFATQHDMYFLLHLLCAKIGSKIKGKPLNRIKEELDLNLIIKKARMDVPDYINLIGTTTKMDAPNCNCNLH